MFRNIFRFRTYHWGGLIPFYQYRDPYDDTERIVRVEPETGWERVRALFVYRENGYVSPEYISTVQLSGCSFAFAFIVGSVDSATKAFDGFLTQNQSTKFVSAYEARRKLTDTVVLEGIKKGLVYGGRCAVFTFIMGLGSIIIAAYRDKKGILEYILGAGLAGAVVRLYTGVVGMAVGCGVGAFLGMIIGTVMWVVGEISGTTVQDTHKMLFDFKVYRDRGESETRRNIQTGSYESPTLRRWLENKCGRKLEHKLHDDDKKFIVQAPVTTDIQEASNGNDTERGSTDKVNATEIPVAANHEKRIEEKSESSKR